MNISFYTTSFVKYNDYLEDLSKESSAQSNSRDIDESGSIYHTRYNENFIMKNFLQFPTKCEFSFTWWMCIVHTNCYLEWVDRNFESFKLLCRLLQATSIPMMWRYVVWFGANVCLAWNYLVFLTWCHELIQLLFNKDQVTSPTKTLQADLNDKLPSLCCEKIVLVAKHVVNFS